MSCLSAAITFAGAACSRAYDEQPIVDDAGGGLDVIAPEAETGSQTACTEGRTVCSGECTDTTSDRDNCGGCGRPCGNGETCVENRCVIECISSLQCNDVCIDPQTDSAHCGGCDKPCGTATPYCVQGTCSPSCGGVNTLCGGDAGPAYCANLQSDAKNCGACGKACTTNQTCSAGACKNLCATGAASGDSFAANMVGCTGKVTFTARASLCAAGFHVCTPQEWVARRAAKAPKYVYWTNVNLFYTGSDGTCAAAAGGTTGFYGCNQPMRVCNGYTDALGNRCNWKGCGLETKTPNQFFGGCNNNTTAGTLCCQ